MEFGIENAFAGKEIRNWTKIDAEKLAKEGKAQRHIGTPDKREAVNRELKEAKQDSKIQDLVIAVGKMAKEGKNWTEIYHVLHLRRLGKREQTKLKQIFDESKTNA